MTPYDFTKGLANYLENLKVGYVLEEWSYDGKADYAYPTPGGSWEDFDGYVFNSNDFSFVVRSIPETSKGSYIAVESNNLERQLANIKLSRVGTFVQEKGVSRLIETYSMTIGYGMRRENVREAFKRFGFESDIITTISDEFPNWKRVVLDILKWSSIREQVKTSLLEIESEEDLPEVENTKRHTLQNTGASLRNDVVFDSDSFDLINYSYSFTIFPKTKFWRFGIRLYKSREIEFNLDIPRHLNKEYKDLHLAVGNPPEERNWQYSNRIELAQYNFEGVPHIENRCENYVELSPVQFDIKHNLGTKTFHVLYLSGECEKFETDLEFGENRYFKIFAWADGIDFKLEFEFQVLSQINDGIVGGVGLASNLPEGFDTPDHLDFQHDIDAFASLIAYKKSSPPLAIGLFGNWGTGKSFFMEKLREKIDARKNDGNVFCQNVVHVPFNSWHYSDANLWASLVTQIFDKLNVFAKGKLDLNEIDELEVNKLYENLYLTSQVLDETRLKLELTKRNKDEAEQRLQLAEAEKNQKAETLKFWTQNWNEVEFILNDEYVKKDVEFIRNSLGDEVLADYNSISKEVQELKSFGNKIKEMLRILFSARKGFMIALLFAIVICFITYLIGDIYREKWGQLISFITKTLGSLLALFIAFKSAFAPAWKMINSGYNRLISLHNNWEVIKKRQIERKTEREKELQKEIEDILHKETSLNKEIKIQELQIERLTEEIQNIGSGVRLAEFIKSTSDADKYSQQLGIISWIRKDFEELDKLLRKQEKIQNRDKPGEKIKIQLQVDRIILYIDDLDRCSETRVVQVLEAVHLLLTFPIFVVVVGVDPRWLSNSLDHKLGIELGKKKVGAKQEILNGHKATSFDYLEKIFQVPFALREMEEVGVKKLINFYLVEDAKRINGEQYGSNNQGGNIVIGDKNTGGENPNEGTQRQKFNPVQLPKTVIKKNDPRLMEISPEEIEFMEDIAGIIGNSPRSVKRYLNIYRLVKSHYEVSSRPHDMNRNAVIMVLLAIVVGQGKYAENFCIELNNTACSTFGEFLIKYKLPENIQIVLNKPSIESFRKAEIYKHRNLLNLVFRFSFRMMYLK